MNIAAATEKAETERYRVTGMDCPSCAGKIEKAVRSALYDGRIAEEGGPELAEELEASGYERFVKATA